MVVSAWTIASGERMPAKSYTAWSLTGSGNGGPGFGVPAVVPLPLPPGLPGSRSMTATSSRAIATDTAESMSPAATQSATSAWMASIRAASIDAACASSAAMPIATGDPSGPASTRIATSADHWSMRAWASVVACSRVAFAASVVWVYTTMSVPFAFARLDAMLSRLVRVASARTPAVS